MAKGQKRIVLKRVIRRVRVHLNFLKMGLRDRLEPRKSLRVEKVDAKRAEVQFSLIWPAPQFPKGLLRNAAGQALHPMGLGRARLGRAAGRRFRHYFWVSASRFSAPAPSASTSWKMYFSNKPMRLLGAAGPFRTEGKGPSIEQLAAMLCPAPPRPGGLAPALADLREQACSNAARAKFSGAWVMVDRADRADDNAEHFYRYLQGCPEADRIFFVLNPDSPDWPRLAAEGFRLLAFGSADHVAAVANAAVIASSQTTLPVLWPAARICLQDLVSYRFAFLQHGVIMNDLSDWLNGIAIDLFITSTAPEYAAITDPEGPYRYSDRDTALTGLARHDALLGRPRSRRYLTIAPTWRNWLTGQVDAVTMLRPLKPGFAQSDYAKNWAALLSDPRLKALAQAEGLEILLLPHPNLRPYFPELQLPDHVQIHDQTRHGTYQEVIAATALCITDYSSLSMDMAVLDVPVVYFQFDAAQVFGGQHSIAPGYFEYHRDGFGPVTDSLETTLAAAIAQMTGRTDPCYADRRSICFPTRDGQNSARIRAAILAML